MANREEVIRGIECCVRTDNGKPNPDCKRCPYFTDWGCKENGEDRLLLDALALLKAQEPRVMTLEEWREWKRKPLSQRDPVYYVDNKGIGSWIAPNDQLFIYATPELGYGTLFICWTSRPTDEQRRAETPWE